MIVVQTEKMTTIRVSETTLKEFNLELVGRETGDECVKRLLKELKEYRRRCG